MTPWSQLSVYLQVFVAALMLMLMLMLGINVGTLMADNMEVQDHLDGKMLLCMEDGE